MDPMNRPRPFSPNRPDPLLASAVPAQPTPSVWLRWLLLCLILAAFGRLVWQLDLKTLWWDESLSLQRAESSWADLLLGRLPITDGVDQVATRDQHPFTFFLLLGLLVRLAGISEFVLRFPSVLAATLLVPTVWVFARRLARHDIAPASAPVWAALLTAVSPFFLWYGQEARPYVLWAWLGLLTTYLLMRWAGLGQENNSQNGPRRMRIWRINADQSEKNPRESAKSASSVAYSSQARWGWAYGALLPVFLFTHYFGVLLLPIHGLLIFGHWVGRRPWLAWTALGGILILAGGLGAAGGWWLLGQPGAGSNLRTVSLGIMVRDMLNAYSLGLSVDITQVWWLDLIYAGLAGLGLLWGARRVGTLLRGGWLLPVYVLIPVLALYAVSLVQPVYMNARHLSLIAPAFLLLVGSGLGAIWGGTSALFSLGTVRKAAALAVVAIMLAGVAGSTVSYFTDPAYSKGGRLDLMGADLRRQIQPGDVILVDPPFGWRMFAYYLPLDSAAAHIQDANTGWRAVPLVGGESWPRTFAFLDGMIQTHRRIWLVTEGTHPYIDPDKKVEAYLQQNAFRVIEAGYFSPNTYLELDLFLPAPPIRDDLPLSLPNQPRVPAVFGRQIRLHGYDVGTRFSGQSMIPVTLYWDPLVDIQQRFKYILELAAVNGPQAGQILARTEREPYNGFLPTLWWRPGPIIQEYSDLLPQGPLDPSVDYELRITMYDADTLQPLAVDAEPGFATAALPGFPRIEDRTLITPFYVPPVLP